MSNYRIPTKENVESSEKIVVRVGWDNPLQTFFATALIPAEDDDEEDTLLLEAGSFPEEIETVDKLAELVSPWAEISENTARRLEKDKAERTEPTPLQKMAAKRMRSFCDSNT